MKIVHWHFWKDLQLWHIEYLVIPNNGRTEYIKIYGSERKCACEEMGKVRIRGRLG